MVRYIMRESIGWNRIQALAGEKAAACLRQTGQDCRTPNCAARLRLSAFVFLLASARKSEGDAA